MTPLLKRIIWNSTDEMFLLISRVVLKEMVKRAMEKKVTERRAKVKKEKGTGKGQGKDKEKEFMVSSRCLRTHVAFLSNFLGKAIEANEKGMQEDFQTVKFDRNKVSLVNSSTSSACNLPGLSPPVLTSARYAALELDDIDYEATDEWPNIKETCKSRGRTTSRRR